jgi:hypothetical protein
MGGACNKREELIGYFWVERNLNGSGEYDIKI